MMRIREDMLLAYGVETGDSPLARGQELHLARVQIEHRRRRRSVQPSARFAGIHDQRLAARLHLLLVRAARGSRSRATTTDRLLTSPMSCTSRIRRPPISKLCGDSNSSAPNPACARDSEPLVVAVVPAEHAGQRHLRVLERLERKRRAVVARVQHHPPPPPGSAARARRSRAGDRACRPSVQRASGSSCQWGSATSRRIEIVVLLALRDHREPRAVHQHFRRPGPAL